MVSNYSDFSNFSDFSDFSDFSKISNLSTKFPKFSDYIARKTLDDTFDRAEGCESPSIPETPKEKSFQEKCDLWMARSSIVGAGLCFTISLLSVTISNNPSSFITSLGIGSGLSLVYQTSKQRQKLSELVSEKEAIVKDRDDALRKITLILDEGDRFHNKQSDVIHKLERELKECEVSKKILREREQELSLLKNEIDKLTDQKNEWFEKHETLSDDHKTLKEQWGQVLAQLSKCEVEHRKEIEFLEREISKKNEEITKYKIEKDYAEKNRERDIEHAVSEANAKLNELNAVNERLWNENEHLNRQIKSLEETIRDSVEGHNSELESLREVFNDSFEELKRDKKRCEDRIKELEAELVKLNEPRFFYTIGDGERANKLIEVLHKEHAITLDAGELVPFKDNKGNTGFEVFLNLKNKIASSQALIDELDKLGNSLSIRCHTLNDLKFELDKLNPHRIKTTMLTGKGSVNSVNQKEKVDKIWISRELFATKVLTLLKKPSTRVMGATGEGKGIFVNLLLAAIANKMEKERTKIIVRLHDPLDGSSEDFWKIKKTSKGSAETRKALSNFKEEFKRRKETKQNKPAVLEIFDEIDALVSDDSSVAKDILHCATGIRHTGQQAIFIGQSATVGKKGWQWTDMDSFNSVYIGTSALQAIEHNPTLSPKKDKLMKQYEELKDFCTNQNEQLGLDQWNAYRFALVVSEGQSTWIEIPTVDSIPCNWDVFNKVNETLEGADTDTDTDADNTLEKCPKCNSSSLKVTRGDFISKNGTVTKYRQCKDCSHKFEVKN